MQTEVFILRMVRSKSQMRKKKKRNVDSESQTELSSIQLHKKGVYNFVLNL